MLKKNAKEHATHIPLASTQVLILLMLGNVAFFTRHAVWMAEPTDNTCIQEVLIEIFISRISQFWNIHNVVLSSS